MEGWKVGGVVRHGRYHEEDEESWPGADQSFKLRES